jgi:hypothetical protein
MKMKNLILAALVMSMTSIAGAAELESGLKPGDSPPPFNVRDITGPKAGKTLCYRCMYGARPVVTIFTRDIDENVANLIKEVDNQVGANGDKKMAAFVVLLTDDADAAEGTLKTLAKKKSIKNVPLTVYDGTAGPSSYKIAKDADVTVMMWNESDVKVNHAFAKGQLTKKSVSAVAGDSAKILE